MRIGQLAMGVIVMLLCVQPAAAVLVKETCINETHELLYYRFTLMSGGIPEDMTYTQVHECTLGCVNNRCVDTHYSSDLGAAVFFAMLGLLSLIYLLATVFGYATKAADAEPSDGDGVVSGQER